MKSVSLFGAGGELKKFIAIARCLDLSIEMIVDNSRDKWGKMECGYVIKRPENLHTVDTQIIISSTYREQIYVQLVNMGLQNRVAYLEDIIIQKDDEYLKGQDMPSIVLDTIFGVGWGGMEMWSYRIGCALDKRGYQVSIYGEINQEKQDKIYEKLIYRFDVWEEDYDKAVQVLYLSLKQKLPFTLIDNWTEHLFIAAWILKQQYPDKVKILSVVHNDEDSLYRVKKLWERSFDRILAVSKKIERHLINALSFPQSRVLYRPNFLHYEVTEMDTKRKIYSGEKIRIGWGARIEEKQKRADLLIPFIRLLEERNVDYVLNIAGDGKYKKTLESWVLTNHLNNKIFFWGYIDAQKMKNFWVNQDIYISLSDYEGFSLAMIEAMANGAIPIVTRVSGTDDFIQDGITGYLINVNSPFEAADKISDLYEDRKRMNTISNNVVRMVKEKCDFGEYMDFIDESLKKME